MGVLTRLHVVNSCLATMGEAPLNEVQADHPYAQAALRALDNAAVIELGRGWWFNTDEVQLLPDATTGNVPLPADVLDVDTAHTRLVQRGPRLYDRVEATYDLRKVPAPIRAVLVRNVPFEDLPATAQQLLAARAVLDFQSAYDSDPNRYRELGASYQQIFNTLRAQHIRNSNVNVFHAPGVAGKLNNIAPQGGMRRSFR